MNKPSEAFKNAIKAHLDQCAREDRLFAKSYAKENKSIDECCAFIMQEVHKLDINGLEDAEVFGMAKHYYDEDDLGEIKAPKCRVVVNHQVELTDEEKAEARRKAIEAFEKEELARLRKESTPAVQKPVQSVSSKQSATKVVSPSLFDLLGEDETKE